MKIFRRNSRARLRQRKREEKKSIRGEERIQREKGRRNERRQTDGRSAIRFFKRDPIGPLRFVVERTPLLVRDFRFH